MKEPKMNVNDFWARLKNLTKEHKVTLDKLCIDIGTLPQNMKNKKFRKTFPTLDELVKISSYLGTTIDFLLLGKTDNPLQRRVDELETKLNTIKELASC